MHSSSLAPDLTPSRSQTQLVPCVYIALRCQHCGEFRQALAAAPLAENICCPVCSAACNFQLLGRGLTSSPLPFHELYPREQTPWITHDRSNDDPKNDDEINALDSDTLNSSARHADSRNAVAGEPQALDGS